MHTYIHMPVYTDIIRLVRFSRVTNSGNIKSDHSDLEASAKIMVSIIDMHVYEVYNLFTSLNISKAAQALLFENKCTYIDNVMLINLPFHSCTVL